MTYIWIDADELGNIICITQAKLVIVQFGLEPSEVLKGYFVNCQTEKQSSIDTCCDDTLSNNITFGF